ncbi:MAG: class II aldolase/adducin family protein [Victivallales bacterium]
MKDEKYLYVKPSGVALAKIKPENFVKMDRALIEKIFTHDMPSDVAQREAIAKEFMMAAVCPESSGRPSVEAPLHELIPFRYVVHLHPASSSG